MAQKVKKTRRRKERKNVEHGAAHTNARTRKGPKKTIANKKK